MGRWGLWFTLGWGAGLLRGSCGLGYCTYLGGVRLGVVFLFCVYWFVVLDFGCIVLFCFVFGRSRCWLGFCCLVVGLYLGGQLAWGILLLFVFGVGGGLCFGLCFDFVLLVDLQRCCLFVAFVCLFKLVDSGGFVF